MVDIEELREQLGSDDVDTVFDAIIDIGKKGVYSLEPEVQRCLESPEAAIRSAAIKVLAFYWKQDVYRLRADVMSRTDPDEEVRGTALMAWSGYYAGTRDAGVMRRLHDLLCDPDENEYVRAQAYPALLAVAGLPPAEWPRQTSIYGDIQGGVDWALVERLMSTASTGPCR